MVYCWEAREKTVFETKVSAFSSLMDYITQLLDTGIIGREKFLGSRTGLHSWTY